MDTIKHPIGLLSDMSVLEATLAYLELGISVIPVKGKAPAIAWSLFQVKCAPFSFVHNWNQARLLKGVGVITGKVSGNLVVIDLDGESAVERFELEFPTLLDTYTVLSGSGKGKHIYFYVDELPPTTRTKGFELRAEGCYVVAPPSLHPETGNKYAPLNDYAIRRVSDLRQVQEYIRNLIPIDRPPVPKNPVPTSTATPDYTSKYAQNARTFYFNRAVEGEVSRVLTASQGEQNNKLFRAALHLGRLINAGLERGFVEDVLLKAAFDCGYMQRDGYPQTWRTIQSGINRGLADSKDIPGPKDSGNGKA